MFRQLFILLGSNLSRFFLVGLIFIFSSGVTYASKLIDVQFASLAGGQVEITLSFDDVPPEPKGYTIENPARIAIDLFGTVNSLSEKYYRLGVGNARGLTVMGVGDRTRIIIGLTELTEYNTRIEDYKLVVVLGSGVQKRVVSDTNSIDVPLGISEKSKIKSGSKTIEGIDFRRGENGGGNVIVTLSDPSTQVDIREESSRIILKFLNASLPERLQRRLDVVDFATPVQNIDAVVEDGSTLLVVRSSNHYEYMAYQTGNQYTISVKPITEEELEKKKKEKFIFTGEKLSLNFQDIEIRSVLQLIADFTGLNLVASDTVAGKLTLRLQNIPWDQALDLILKTKGLDKRTVGNVMLVAPAEEISAREKLELEASRQVEELAPLKTEFIQVNYAKAVDIVAVLGGEANGFISGRGSIAVDERTNTLLVTETIARLEIFRSMLAKLDVPVQQVLIEARIVAANSDFSHELGVKWGTATYHTSNDESVMTAGSSEQILETFDGFDDNEFTVTSPNNLIVDLGAEESTATSFALGYFKNSLGLLELEISAMETSGNADIIATPKILTADQQTARIASGTEVPYQEASSSGATSVSFKEAVLSLEVTPHITPDRRIIMDLQVNQDTIGEIFNDIPAIDTNQIQTQVLVDNGETVVLGGVFRIESIDSVTKTPFFGDLPIIGRLFRNKSRTEDKQELLIFITPKLVQDVITQ